MQDFLNQVGEYQPWVFLWTFIGLVVCFLFVGRLMEKRRNPLSYLLWAPLGFLLWPFAGLWVIWYSIMKADRNGKF